MSSTDFDRWIKTDPREHIFKQARIIVHTAHHILGAYVETKHDWSVHFERSTQLQHEFGNIEADDKWPEGWSWRHIS